MNEERKELEARSERFALGAIALIRTFSLEEPGPTAKRQLAKCATSVAANYRASGRSRTHKEFASKISQVAEEADECLYWLGVAQKVPLTKSADLLRLLDEADQLTAIFTAMSATAKRNERARRRR
jgi:four helix bundle protein